MDVSGCDDRIYQVHLLVPVSYELLAKDAEEAERLGKQVRLAPVAMPAECVVIGHSVGFPDSVRVEEVGITANGAE